MKADAEQRALVLVTGAAGLSQGEIIASNGATWTRWLRRFRRRRRRDRSILPYATAHPARRGGRRSDDGDAIESRFEQRNLLPSKCGAVVVAAARHLFGIAQAAPGARQLAALTAPQASAAAHQASALSSVTR